jgi:hypothetical protein
MSIGALNLPDKGTSRAIDVRIINIHTFVGAKPERRPVIHSQDCTKFD